MSVIDLNIGIPSSAITHIKEKSSHNDDYYHIEAYGDWFHGKLDTVHQEFVQCDEFFYYSFGYFKKDEFVPMMFWGFDEDVFKEVER